MGVVNEVRGRFQWLTDPVRGVVAEELRFSRKLAIRLDEMLMFGAEQQQPLRDLIGCTQRVRLMGHNLCRRELRWHRKKQELSDRDFAKLGLQNAELLEEFLQTTSKLRSTAKQLAI